MSDGKDSMRRVRVSIPYNDEEVLLWMEAQDNVSMSVRELIKDWVYMFGTRDYFSSTEGEISGKRRVGRPRKRAVPHDMMGSIATAVIEALHAYDTRVAVDDEELDDLEIENTDIVDENGSDDVVDEEPDDIVSDEVSVVEPLDVEVSQPVVVSSDSGDAQDGIRRMQGLLDGI